MKYHHEINQIIKSIIKSSGLLNANKAIKDIDIELNFEDENKLKNIVEKNLMVLHEGQLVIYGITSEEFTQYCKKTNK